MFHCPVEVWVIEQRAIILSATVRSPTVYIELFMRLASMGGYDDAVVTKNVVLIIWFHKAFKLWNLSEYNNVL